MAFDSDARDKEFLHWITYFHKLLELIAITQAQIRVKIANLGHYVKYFDGSGFVGGNLSAIETDQQGEIHSATIQVACILQCGHVVESISQIAGVCGLCGSVCCNLHLSCLRVCEISGITVCRQHYSIKNGVVVSAYAQRRLTWRFEARKIARQKELIYARTSLTDGK